MLMFTLAISCLTTSNLPWLMGLTFQYAILFFTALDLTFITSHIHNWVLFLLWLHLFILPEVISPLFSSRTFCTYKPREFIFQCPIFLPCHTVHDILKARILKWFAIHFSSEPRFVRTLHHDPSILGGPTGSSFPWVREGCGPCDRIAYFSVILSALWWRMIRGLWELLDRRDWQGETGSCSDGWSLAVQIFNSIFCWCEGAVFPPCCLTWGQTTVKVMKIMAMSFKRTNHYQKHIAFLATYNYLWLSQQLCKVLILEK